jgi:hypothetical protein
MEIKELKRPLVVIGMKHLGCPLSDDYLEDIMTEVPRNHSVKNCCVIKGEDECEDWRVYVQCNSSALGCLTNNGLMIAELFRDECYEDITTLYSTYSEVFNIDWDGIGERPEQFYQCALEVLFGGEDTNYYIDGMTAEQGIKERTEYLESTEFDVFYYDDEGNEQLFSVVNGGYDDPENYSELLALCQTLKK